MKVVQRSLLALLPWFAAACNVGSGVEVPQKAGNDIYSQQVNSLEGEAMSLEAYRGQVALVVNTASKCGFTPQYEDLQKLYETYGERGFVVLGFPCNDFMGQEPGSAGEIRTFCTDEYGVTFPMFEKVQVKEGEGQSELYRLLGEAAGTLPSWNFGKYLVARDGQVDQFFGTRVSPTDDQVTQAIERLLTGEAVEAMAASVQSPAPALSLESDYGDFPAETSYAGKALTLNGYGLCEWGLLGFNLYRAGLYVENTSNDADTLLAVDQTMLIYQHFVRKLSESQLQDAFRASVRYQIGEDSELEPQLQALLNWMVDVRKGDAMAFVVDENQHLVGYLNGEPMGKIETPEFGKLFIQLYLGSKPPTEALKKGMLGL